MSDGSDIKHNRWSDFNIHMYFVFVARNRRRIFDARAIDVLRGIFADVCADAQATLVEMDDEDNHAHLLVKYPPKVAVSSIANSLQFFQSLAAPTAS